ncbi:MAG: hypothetical protein ACRDHY_02135, partial [Anaerolineales bacterium]
MQSIRQWTENGGAQVRHAPDLPHAARLLASEPWDVVLAALGERPDEELTWWADALRSAEGGPRLIGLAHEPSMGLVLRAERLGVLDLLSLPVRREQLLHALALVRSAATQVRIPLPPVESHAVGRYALVGQSPAMLEVYKLIARVAPST